MAEVCDLGACTKPLGHEGRCGFDLGTLAPADAGNIAGLLGADINNLPSAAAALERSSAEAVRYAELAHARWEVAERLRGELAVARGQLREVHVAVLAAAGEPESSAEIVTPMEAVRELRLLYVQAVRDRERDRAALDAPGRHRVGDGGVS